MAQVIKKRIAKIAFWLVAGLLILIIGAAAAIQIPYVQTALAQRLANYLTSTTGYVSTVSYVTINWFDKMVIEDLMIKDQDQNTMIKIDELLIDFDLRALFNQPTRKIDEVILFNAHVNLIKADSTVLINITDYVNRLKELSKSDKKGEFKIDKIKLFSSNFSYDDQAAGKITDRFDYRHFKVKNIKAELTNFFIHSDTVDITINKLTGTDSLDQIKILNLNSNFSISQRHLQFDNLLLETNNSVLKDSVVFLFSGTEDLSSFNDSVTVYAKFSESHIYSQDLALFAPAFKRVIDRYNFSGIFYGKVTDFRLTNLFLNFGRGSIVQGDFSLAGLPEITETFMNANFKRSRIITRDLKPYFKENTFNIISRFDTVSLTANLIGFPNDFVAQGNFITNLGRARSDLNLKIGEIPSETSYRGSLVTTEFDIGTFLKQPDLFQKVTMSGNIRGKGFKLETAQFDLAGSVKSIGINHYNFKNIKTDAQFARQYFNGSISIDDPNLKFTADGSVDLRNQRNKVDVSGKLDTAFLKPIGIINEDVFLSGSADVDFIGLHIDSVRGSAYLKDIKVKLDDRVLMVDSLNFLSSFDENNRHLELGSDKVQVTLDGNFHYSILFSDLKDIINEYRLFIKNDHDSLKSYYTQKMLKSKPQETYYFNYRLTLQDLNPVINLFLPTAHLSKNTLIRGKFTGGYTSIFSINASIDTLRIDDHYFYDSDIELSASKIRDSTEVLAFAYLFSNQQKIKNLAETENLFFEGFWDDNHIDFAFNIKQLNVDNYANVEGELDFLPDEISIHIRPSDIQAIGEKWLIRDSNLIGIRKGEITFKNLSLYKGEEHITINGYLSGDSSKALELQVRNLQLQNLNPLLKKDISGLMNGVATFKNMYSDPFIESEFKINDFYVNQFLVGDLTGLSEWHISEKHFDLNFFVDRQQNRIISVDGTFTPSHKTSPVDLKAEFNQAKLSILEPFIDKYFSKLKGNVNGSFDVTGHLNNLIVDGKAKIDSGTIKVNYLNTEYSLTSDVIFKPGIFTFENLVVTDRYGNLANFGGSVRHSGFKGMTLDLQGQMNNFLVLNTSSKDNELFYGLGKATGDVSFKGPVNNLFIKANVKSEKDTEVFIPIGGTSNIEQEDFISFVSFNDSTQNMSLKESDQVDLRGLNLEIDLEITPDAYAEIIFDITAGDIIRGRGNGKIKLNIDTQGGFTMFGDYSFTQGGYNFTMYNIINKEFEILPQSKITWSGDPYEAILDIEATYKQLASIAPLFQGVSGDTTALSHPDMRRRYPTEVLLFVKGPMLQPQIDFDIVVEEYPETIIVNGQPISLSTQVAVFKSRIDSDEQELKRQVFSLVILRKFAPQGAIFNAAGSFGNSVSEFISNQLSYWITQVDENLEIDVDLGKFDQQAFNTFQLRLSYTFLEGRLRVTRAGGFTDQNNEANVSSIAGDWTVEYLLTPDGKFRAKMYNRTNYNSINSGFENQTTTSAGFSLIHTQSFNEIKDLFTNARKQKPEKQPQNKSAAIIKSEDENDPIE